MLFFSYEKLYLVARGDSTRILSIFEYLLKDKRYSFLGGNNWIVNPQFLLMSRANSIQKAECLGLLSFRHYADYKVLNNTSLALKDLPSWVDLSKLTPSTLWQKEGNTIVFPTENPPIVL